EDRDEAAGVLPATFLNEAIQNHPDRRATCDPLQHLCVFVVVRIGDHIEQVVVSPGSADILWWAASDGFDQTRVGFPSAAAMTRSNPEPNVPLKTAQR